MTHYDLINPAHVDAAPSLAERAAQAVLGGLGALADANPRVQQFNAIWALSDAELDERGLKRGQIAAAHFARNIAA